MTLPSFQLSEPLISAMVTVLKAGLNANIAALNLTLSDTYKVDPVVQFLPYVPVPSTIEGGIPIVGVQEMPARILDDLQSSASAEHEYAVVATIQNADQQALAWQLRRTMQAIAYTIQQDRLLGGSSVMRTQGGAYSVNLTTTVPGPLLGDLDPTNPEAPPRSYLSWCALTMTSRRDEQQ